MTQNYAILSTKTNRSSHQRCSIKKGALKNFAKFKGKHLCQSLFLSEPLSGLRLATLLKKSSWYRSFPVNFAKFSRTPFLQDTSGRLLLHRRVLIYIISSQFLIKPYVIKPYNPDNIYLFKVNNRNIRKGVQNVLS